jgi:hypothetical protein
MDELSRNQVNFRMKREFSDILSAAFNFLKYEFKTLFKPMLIRLGLIYFVLARLMDLFINSQSIQSMAVVNASKSLLLLPLMLIVELIALDFVKKYVAGEEPQNISIAESLRGNLLPAIGWTIASVAIIIVGCVFLLIPGIYMLIITQLVLPVIVLRKDKETNPISRSYQLISGNWWKTFAVVFVFATIMYSIQFLLSIPAYIYLFVDGLHETVNQGLPTWLLVYSDFITSITTVLIFGLNAVLMSLLYFSLIEQKEMGSLSERVMSYVSDSNTIQSE